MLFRSGNAMTKITKTATIVFMVLAIVLGYLHDKVHTDSSALDFAKLVQQKQMQPAAQPAPAAAPAKAPASQPASDNLLSTLPVATNNAPAAK